MKKILIFITGVTLGGLIAGLSLNRFGGLLAIDDEQQGQPKPLYWVAPMDPNFRRDEPGKSPMGMDLVPVYEQQQDMQAGTIKIDPVVQNNLGVRIAKTKLAPLNSKIRTVGYIEYDEDKLVHIHPRVAGWLDKLFVKASGEYVEKGQPLYQLYSPELVNAQEEYLLALKRGNAKLIGASSSRLKALQMPQDAIANLAKTRKVSQSVVFTAPQSGVVDNLMVREGFYVKPGNNLMSIGDLDQVWVEAAVFERQASLVKKGLQVTMSLDYLPARSWTGVVDYVYPVLDAATRTVRLRLRFDNADGALKPNMFAQIVIHAQDEKDTLIVPRQAVIRTADQDRVVLALGDGKFKSVEIKPGRISQHSVEVLSGLQLGDEIVVSAQFLLDSESSIDSDFMRFSAPDMDEQMHSTQQPDSATVKGIVNQIDWANRTVNISREAIEKWNRGPATMDFEIAADLLTSEIVEGQAIEFTFIIEDDHFIVTEFTVVQQLGSIEAGNHD